MSEQDAPQLGLLARENEEQQRDRKTFKMFQLHMPTDKDNEKPGKEIHQVLN